MKYYAVLDTNVLVSTMLSKTPDSPVVKLLEAIRFHALIPMYNFDILTEYSEVLCREKFCFDRRLIEDILSLIKKNGIDCNKVSVSEVFPDPDDVVFYEVAMSREDSYLVTGNLKHFPKNGRVVSPAEMLQIIEYGELRNDYLSDVEPPLFSPFSLEEINAEIAAVRAEWHSKES